jgi:hypothetical protein
MIRQHGILGGLDPGGRLRAHRTAAFPLLPSLRDCSSFHLYTQDFILGYFQPVLSKLATCDSYLAPPNKFVIPTEAQRSGGTCCAPAPQTKAPAVSSQSLSECVVESLAHRWVLRLGCGRTAGPSTSLRFGRDDKFVWGRGRNCNWLQSSRMATCFHFLFLLSKLFNRLRRSNNLVFANLDSYDFQPSLRDSGCARLRAAHADVEWIRIQEIRVKPSFACPACRGAAVGYIPTA